jgi:hypothetical protein
MIFFVVRGRPNAVLNRRLPEATARNVLPSVSCMEISYSFNGSTCGPRVETFPGAACLTRFAVIDAARQKLSVSRARSKAAPLQGASIWYSPFAWVRLIGRRGGREFGSLRRIFLRKHARSSLGNSYRTVHRWRRRCFRGRRLCETG